MIAKFSDSTARAIRTGFDTVLGVLAVALVIIPTLGAFGVDADGIVYAAALVVAATATVSKARNALEDAGFLPALAYPKPEEDFSEDDFNLS